MIRRTLLILSLACWTELLWSQEATLERQFEIPSDAELQGVGPMRRYDWFRNIWNKRRTTFESNREASEGAVVFLGDSITQGWKDDFSGAFAGLRKANRGISGDTTRGMLYRLEQDVLSLDPTAVVLLMGTNDLEEKGTPQQIASNVRQIVEAIEQHSRETPILLCLVMPSSESKSRPADAIKEINQLYREIARQHEQVTLVDTWTPFADESGNAKREEFPDLLHPNAKGYAKWEQILRPALQSSGLLNK